jgi:hypothetical protein
MKVNTWDKQRIDAEISGLIEGRLRIRDIPGLSDAQAAALDNVLQA